MKRYINKRLGKRVAAAALLLPLGACDLDRLLEVDDLDVVVPDALQDSAAIPTVLNGALYDLQRAYGGADLAAGLVVATGLAADEFYSSDTNTARNEIDQRNINRNDNTLTRNPFLATQQLRVSARRVSALVERTQDANRAQRALALSLEGYAEVMLAENYCSGVPLSEEVDGQLVFGEPQTTAQLFQSAAGRFDAALGVSGATSTYRNLAQIGLGRALVNLGRFADAAAAVASVPTSFVYRVEHSNNSTNQYNSVFALQDNFRFSVANREAGEGLPFRDAMDPRVPWVFAARNGFDAVTPLYLQRKYPSYEADIPLASGIEARLIEAEAALNKGESAAYLPVLNDLRANVATLLASGPAVIPPGFNLALAPLTDPGTPEARVDQLFRERAFWLYATAHRLGDLRRLVRQYQRPTEQVFPTGGYHKEGATYGTDVSLPVPVEEDNNAVFREGVTAGCLTRDA